MNLADIHGRRFPGATDAELQAMIAQIGSPLPEAHLQLLRQSNGIVFDDSAILYSTTDVFERNETFEVSHYAPAEIAIGDDGGGRLILIERKSSPTSRVFVIDSGSLGSVAPEVVGNSIEEWAAGGFQTRLPDTHEPVPEVVDVFLVGIPSGGAKSLISIKTELGLEIGIGELANGLKRLPFRLLSHVPYGKYLVLSRKLNERFSACLELRDAE